MKCTICGHERQALAGLGGERVCRACLIQALTLLGDIPTPSHPLQNSDNAERMQRMHEAGYFLNTAKS